MRNVAISAIAVFSPAGSGDSRSPAGALGPARPGEVPGFRARDWIANRKSLKMMSRAVQLGVAAATRALAADGDWESVPPASRALFVGANPLGANLRDLLPALRLATDAEGRLDHARFGAEAIPRIHPLWLVRGLSNNVLGFASAQHDFQGANANYCQGPASGLLALHEAASTVAEGRAELALAGAADALTGAEGWLEGPLSEGAAFFVLRPARPGDRWRVEPRAGDAPPLRPEPGLGELGVAAELVSLARALLRGEGPFLLRSGGLALLAGPAS